jgi:regulation of enolase protein 1 (concanavalin A-like superfamily)
MTFTQCIWLKPAIWRLDSDPLTVLTDRSTDF